MYSLAVSDAEAVLRGVALCRGLVGPPGYMTPLSAEYEVVHSVEPIAEPRAEPIVPSGEGTEEPAMYEAVLGGL